MITTINITSSCAVQGNVRGGWICLWIKHKLIMVLLLFIASFIFSSNKNYNTISNQKKMFHIFYTINKNLLIKSFKTQFWSAHVWPGDMWHVPRPGVSVTCHLICTGPRHTSDILDTMWIKVYFFIRVLIWCCVSNCEVLPPCDNVTMTNRLLVVFIKFQSPPNI